MSWGAQPFVYADGEQIVTHNERAGVWDRSPLQIRNPNAKTQHQIKLLTHNVWYEL